MVQAGGGGGELGAAELELVAPTLVASAGVRTVLVSDALSHGVELIKGAHTIRRLHQARRP